MVVFLQGKPDRENSSSARTKCPAMLSLLRTEDGGWYGSACGVPNLEVWSAFMTGASATRTRLAFHLRWCCDDLLKYEQAASLTAHTLRYIQSIGVRKHKIAHPLTQKDFPLQKCERATRRGMDHIPCVVSLLPVPEEKMASFPWGCTSVQYVSYK